MAETPTDVAVATKPELLLSPTSLRAQVDAVALAIAPGKSLAIARAEETLRLLETPSISATVAVMLGMTPADQAIISSVAVALRYAGVKRDRLVAGLKAVVESVS